MDVTEKYKIRVEKYETSYAIVGEPKSTIGVLIEILSSRAANHISAIISGKELSTEAELIHYIISNGKKDERYPISAEMRGQVCIYRDITKVYDGLRGDFPIENFDTLKAAGDDTEVTPLLTLPSSEVQQIILAINKIDRLKLAQEYAKKS